MLKAVNSVERPRPLGRAASLLSQDLFEIKPKFLPPETVS